MKNYTIRIKTAQFNAPFVVNYEAEKNQPVDIVTKDGCYLGLYLNGHKKTSVIANNSITIEVEL